jgi:hypothetical protein
VRCESGKEEIYRRLGTRRLAAGVNAQITEQPMQTLVLDLEGQVLCTKYDVGVGIG